MNGKKIVQTARMTLVFFLFAGVGLCVGAQDSPLSREDNVILRAMGSPFFSGAILPAPREAEYSDGSVALADGKAGLVLCDVSFSAPPELEE